MSKAKHDPTASTPLLTALAVAVVVVAVVVAVVVVAAAVAIVLLASACNSCNGFGLLVILPSLKH